MAACCYYVLIASSGDTAAEREHVFDTISAWSGGSGGTRRKVIFIPLMWEKHAISDADARPQDGINRQLLDRSDFVIAIFKGRIGTPTRHYPGGTIEELAKRRGRAAVFFCDADLVVTNKKLNAFRARFRGFYRNYKDPDDLSNKVRDQLEGWETDLAKEQPETFLAMYPRPWTADRIAKHIDNSSHKISLLIYNTELQGFRSKEDFEGTWSCLQSRDFIENVVFLMPAYKIERLREYLSKICDDIGRERLRRFSICQMLEDSKQAQRPSRLTSSLASEPPRIQDGLSR